MIVYWVPTRGGFKTEFKWGRAKAVLDVSASGEDEWECSLTFDGKTDEAMIFNIENKQSKDARKAAVQTVQSQLHDLVDQFGGSFDPIGRV